MGEAHYCRVSEHEQEGRKTRRGVVHNVEEWGKQRERTSEQGAAKHGR